MHFSIFLSIRFFDDYQLSFDDVRISDADYFILVCCMEDMTKLSLLSRRKKQKIRDMLDTYSRTLKLDNDCFNVIISCLKEYCQPWIPKFKIATKEEDDVFDT